jgi:hypothetical protein
MRGLARAWRVVYPVIVRLDEKTRENLEAAERLLPTDDGARDALPNAAASRAYYAAYLAVADRGQRLQRAFTDRDVTYYRHDTLPDDAYAWGIVDDDRRDGLRWLYGLRIKADYFEDQVELAESSDALTVAKDLLDVMLEES